MPAYCPSEQRAVIIFGADNNLPIRAIADLVGCGKTAVADTIKIFKETGSTERKPRPGRPPLLDTPKRKQLLDLVTADKENRRLCLNKVHTLFIAHTDQEVSKTTIRRNLQKVGLNSRIPS